MFVERSTQYTSLSSRKQPANAGTERKQFTESASVALQQPILPHAHTKCPPVPCVTSLLFSMLGAPFLAMVQYICGLWFQYCGLLQRFWNWPSNYSEVINVFCTKAEVCLFFSLYKRYCWYNFSPSKSKCKWFLD